MIMKNHGVTKKQVWEEKIQVKPQVDLQETETV